MVDVDIAELEAFFRGHGVAGQNSAATCSSPAAASAARRETSAATRSTPAVTDWGATWSAPPNTMAQSSWAPQSGPTSAKSSWDNGKKADSGGGSWDQKYTDQRTHTISSPQDQRSYSSSYSPQDQRAHSSSTQVSPDRDTQANAPIPRPPGLAAQANAHATPDRAQADHETEGKQWADSGWKTSGWEDNGWRDDMWKDSGWQTSGWISWTSWKQDAATPSTNSKAEPSDAKDGSRDDCVQLPKINGLVGEASAQIVVHDEDPTACYLAARSWEDIQLPKEIMDGIYEMGFTGPSKIQEVALPITMRGNNLIGQAQNGSGKTAAFSLSMLRVCDVTKRTPQAVCLCPTRELARQNGDVISKLGKYTGLTQFLAIPQTDRPPRNVEDQIICGTPGKFHDLVKRRTIDSRNLRMLVLDEADVMINEENNMGSEVCRIRKLLPPDIQILLFSATYPDDVRVFAEKMVPNGTKIEVKKEDLTLATISQMYINCGQNASTKQEMLCDLYSAMNVGQSIIFVNSRKEALALANRTRGEGHAVSLMCGTQKTGPEVMDTAYRDKVMDEFRRGVTKVLISTDVLSRGIDVPAVTLVINYELPVVFGQRGRPETETYMHRIGRTGRFGLKGIAINFVTENEMPLLNQIRQHYGCTIEELPQDVEMLEKRIRSLR